LNGLIQVRGMLGIVDPEERGVHEVNEVSHLLDHRAWGGFTRIDRSSLAQDASVGDSDLVFLGCLAQINQRTESRGSFGMIHGSVLGGSSSLFDGLHNSSTFDEVKAYAEAILNLDGSFSFILTSNHGVIVGRDCMGGKPLYSNIFRDETPSKDGSGGRALCPWKSTLAGAKEGHLQIYI